jgi:hypothetical protein
MNNKDRQQIKSIIDQLNSLADTAEMRSNTIIDNGSLIEDSCRAKSEGYASAYRYCIMILDDFINDKRMKW